MVGGTPRRVGMRRTDDRDCGATLVEILVSIVLLGTVVIGTLAALRVSVIGTRLERDHAKAFQWLQSANGLLQAAPPVGCAGGEEALRLALTTEIRNAATPIGWDTENLDILEPVKVWDGTRYWSPEEWQTANPADPADPCFDETGYYLRLVTMQVTGPDGDIIETLQVVKRDGGE
jgi:hypothetical protein